MRKFGLIGYPLSHSFSQKFFTEKFSKGRGSQTAFMKLSPSHLFMTWKEF